ncbi:MAG: hypothetical protein DCC72_07170 [Burkholderiales bacterium]|nr:MAG: hypothetical protein DCC72_07170 [Burkholderiales bacterium]
MKAAQHPHSSRAGRLAALVAAIVLPSTPMAASSDAADVLARAAVPEQQLEPMRGGLDLGTMIGRFAIERIVRVDGEVVARTQLLVDRLDAVSRGQLPDARLIGNLANLVQIGEGNRASTAPQSSATSSQSQPPTSSGTVSTPNVASGLSTEWGTALAQAVAIANGDQSNRPVPVDVGAVSSAGAGSAPSAAANAATPAAAQGSAGGAAAATAGGIPVVAPVAIPTISITIPVGNGSIVVSGIPNGPALATSIQNSAQATRIETETRIEAALSSLSALRSMNFAAALRQQAVDAARR